MSDKTANLVGAYLLYLTVFGTFKIIGTITVSWWWLLSPVWVPAATFILVMMLAISNKGKGDWSE